MHLKKSLIIAIIFAVIGLTAWELYWRTKPEYYRAYLEDSKYLWAEQRRKVDRANSNDIILLGASRSGHNFNTHVWKDNQGIEPINLSGNGQNAAPYLQDLVNNTNFNGTIVISVTPISWFWNKDSWTKGEKWIEHYNNETYAQKLGHLLSKPLERNLVMLTKTETFNDLDLKSLINRIEIKERQKDNDLTDFKLISFAYNDEDRNFYMYPRMTANKHYQKEITDAWDRILSTLLPDYIDVKDEVNETLKTYKSLTDKFKARGGKIIFIRHKSEPDWIKYQEKVFPKNEVWDIFVKIINCPTYHYEDYEFMSKYTLPDWSHMYYTDALTYTEDMLNKLIEDGYLKRHK